MNCIDESSDIFRVKHPLEIALTDERIEAISIVILVGKIATRIQKIDNGFVVHHDSISQQFFPTAQAVVENIYGVE